VTTTADPYDSIAEILQNPPTGSVLVSGVVYHIIATDINPSYYIYDGTGTILVFNDPRSVTIGQGVTIQASYDDSAPSPQLINVTSFESSTWFTTLPDDPVVAISDLSAHPSSDAAFYGTPMTVTGFVRIEFTDMGPVYFLEDPVTAARVIINAKSFAPTGSNPYAMIVGSKVSASIVVHFFDPMLSMWHVLVGTPTELPPFEPGEGGPLVVPVPSDPIANEFPGLFLTKVGQYLTFSYQGDPVWKPLVEMEFPSAESLGGTGYYLQYYDAGWKDLVYDGLNQPFDAAWDNLSLYLSGGYTLRLLLVGGPLHGSSTNAVSFVPTAVEAEFTGYGYAWGMGSSSTGVMMPFVGFEVYDVYVSATTWIDNQTVDVSSYITIEWYRVDPVTFAMTKIEGASGSSYITTPQDAGYYILFRGIGDGVHVGGYFQQMVQTQVSLPNRGYVSDATANGFTLHLEHAVSGMNAADFAIFDQDGNPVEVASVTPLEGGASYQIVFAETNGVTTSYGVSYTEGAWTVAFAMPFGGPVTFSEYTQVTLTPST
jgi:hypothetical protein